MADCLEYIPTTYDNIERTQELIPNVLQLMQWFHKFTNLHSLAQQNPVKRDDIYHYAYWCKISSWWRLSSVFLFTNPSCRKVLRSVSFQIKWFITNWDKIFSVSISGDTHPTKNLKAYRNMQILGKWKCCQTHTEELERIWKQATGMV
jgi:hypothetical protein